ncbi:MAG: hypothetical protein FJX67_13055 [Alphaproteobacteria bacterium]|nr:hypothetical protein [Alphaproteobacteria bacterium]
MKRTRIGIVILVVALAVSDGGAREAPSMTCGQRFGQTVAADPLTQELACATDPRAAGHCIASDAPERIALPSAIAAAPYTLWVRTAGAAPGGTLRLVRAPDTALRLALPGSTAGAWQRIGRIDLDDRAGSLSILPEGRAGTLDCVVLARDSDFVPNVRAIHRIDRA